MSSVSAAIAVEKQCSKQGHLLVVLTTDVRVLCLQAQPDNPSQKLIECSSSKYDTG